MEIILIIFLTLNIYGYMLMYLDKQKAKRHEWRISEKHLWIVGIVGGAFGLYIGMKRFRHKTKHKQFVILLPLLSLLTIAIYIYFFLKWS